MSTTSAILGTVSAIFAIAIVISSGALLLQAIRIRDSLFYGYGPLTGLGGGASLNPWINGGNVNPTWNSWNNPIGPSGPSAPFLNPNSALLGGLGGRLDYNDYYRYYRVIILTAAVSVAGIIQFLISLLSCCANGNDSDGMLLAYGVGSSLLLIVFGICLALGFYFRVIYPFYIYQYQYQYYYYQYNMEGVVFCAVLGVNVIHLLFSSIVSCALSKQIQSSQTNKRAKIAREIDDIYSEDEQEMEERLRRTVSTRRPKSPRGTNRKVMYHEHRV